MAPQRQRRRHSFPPLKAERKEGRKANPQSCSPSPVAFAEKEVKTSFRREGGTVRSDRAAEKLIEFDSIGNKKSDKSIFALV